MEKGFPFIDFASRLLTESQIKLNPGQLKVVMDMVQAFVSKEMSFELAYSQLECIPQAREVLTKIHEITQVENDPIPDAVQTQELNDILPKNGSENCQRKHHKSWTAYEDNRLLVGVYKFGIDSWTNVAQFVGGGRTRAQCSQRWSRVIDPRLTKNSWTKEEEEKLAILVHEYGDKSWRKVAGAFGNRSDVQCRYKWTSLMRDKKEPLPLPVMMKPDLFDAENWIL